MPKGYVYAELEVTDPATFATYRAGVSGTIAAFGGRYLVRGGNMELVEGSPAPKRVILLEFETPERAREWYDSPAYQELLAIRLKSSTARLIMLTGEE